MSAGTIDPIATGTARPDALTRCTGDADAFLRETWGRRAAVHHAADPRGFSDLLTFDDVDRLLTSTSLRAPAFRVVQAGTSIPESSYTRSGTTGSKPVSGLPDAARITSLFREGATIVLQGLHRYHEPVARFCHDLELTLGHPCQANAYITPPGAQGLALHEDSHDVFTLQAFGRKRWEIHPAPGEPERPPLDTLVGPGDCLYLPEGTPHAATTQDELSGHLTIGVHVGSWREVVAAAVNRVLDADAPPDARVPAGWHRDPEGTARALADRLRAAASAIDAADPAEIVAARIDRFLSSRPAILRGILAAEPRLAGLGDATRLWRRPGSVCEVRSPTGAGAPLVVLLGDRRLEMPAWLEPAMRRIATAEGAIAPGELADVIADPESRLVLARRLVRDGVLLLDEPRAIAGRGR